MNELFEKIKEHEGFRSKPYKCSAGKWTIGYGRNICDVGLSTYEFTHLLKVNTPIRPMYYLIESDTIRDYLHRNGIDKEFASLLFENDVRQAIDELQTSDEGFNIHPEPASDALIDMCFNMGITKLRKFKRMWEAIDKRDFKEAAKEALDSLWAKQVQKARVDWVLEQFNKAAKEEV